MVDNNVKGEGPRPLVNNLGTMISLFVAIEGHKLLVPDRKDAALSADEVDPRRTTMHTWQPGAPGEGLHQQTHHIELHNRPAVAMAWS